MSKPNKFQDWCEKPEIIKNGFGWAVRISGCDVFDSINEFGCKQYRAFDVARGLASKEEAKDRLRDWLKDSLAALDGEK